MILIIKSPWNWLWLNGVGWCVDLSCEVDSEDDDGNNVVVVRDEESQLQLAWSLASTQ